MTSPISSLSGISAMAALAGSGSTTSTTTPATGGIDSTMPTTGSTTGDSTGNLLDPSTFLKLLVAQLQYQDPTSPVDTSAFLNQTATLSQVQTMSTMNDSLNSILSAQQSQAATSMIGKTISWTNQDGTSGSGVATAAQLSSTGATLTVGTNTVPFSSVTSVTEAASTGTSS